MLIYVMYKILRCILMFEAIYYSKVIGSFTKNNDCEFDIHSNYIFKKDYPGDVETGI